MTDKTFTKPIETIVHDVINQQPTPQIVKITRIYPDGYADIENDTFGELKHIRTIIPHNVGDITVLIFSNNSYSERIII